MTSVNPQDPKKIGGEDGGITRRLKALNIKDQATGEGQDSAGGGVARCIKDYCDKAVVNLKAERLEEAYVYANEALELDEKDPKAAALRRYTLYALDPKRRLLDKATALSDEAGRSSPIRNNDKAHELLTLAEKWHCDPCILSFRAVVNLNRGRFYLAYLDATEALGAGMNGEAVVELQKSSLHSLGFKMPPVIESEQQRVDELPAHSPLINQPNGVLVESLLIDLESCAIAMDASYSTLLVPPIPLDQLASFINEQVQGAVKNLMFKGGEGHENTMLRLLDEVTVPGRLHADKLILDDFFHLPWAGIKRILDGRTLRAVALHFLRLQLSSGVDANELIKLPAVCECTALTFQLYDAHLPQLPGPTPLFKNAALVGWLKRNADGRERTLRLAREHLSSGLLGFLDVLKKDFRQATQAYSYCVLIQCPNFDVADGLGVQNEQLSNRLGERMAIVVGENPQSTELMGHRFETVKMERLPPA